MDRSAPFSEPLPLGLLIEGPKAFSKTQNRIPRLFPINLVVGKNNVGKTVLLDILDYAASDNERRANLRRDQPEIFYETPITSVYLDNTTLRRNESHSELGTNDRDYAETFVGQTLTAYIRQDGKFDYAERGLNAHHVIKEKLISGFRSPLEGRSVRRIAAERRVKPEPYDGNTFYYDPNGEGFTFSMYLAQQSTSYDRTWFSVQLLDALNEILEGEAKFEFIDVRVQTSTRQCEIYVEELGKPVVSLSNSGSGLQTLFMVLAELLIVPNVLGRSASQFFYLFEELENNLHPRTQRRLYDYLERFATNYGSIIVLSSHSIVALDQFAQSHSSQILHVTQDGGVARVLSTDGLLSNHAVLDDLGARASDLFQSNGVIWVEGPSDRIVMNRAISILSDGELLEGVDYSMAFYGGVILSHFTSSPSDGSLVNLLRINRNAALLMDRDTVKLNSTKERIRAELDAMNSLCLTTHGLEMESDIPVRLYEKSLGVSIGRGPMINEDFSTYLAAECPGHENLDGSKTSFAELVAEKMEMSDLEEPSRLGSLARQFVDVIRSWS